MEKKDFAFDRINFLLLAAGMVVIIIGLILMSGSGSTETEFNPEIFSSLRIKVAPAVCFIGFVSIIGGIMYQPKDKKQ